MELRIWMLKVNAGKRNVMVLNEEEEFECEVYVIRFRTCLGI